MLKQAKKHTLERINQLVLISAISLLATSLTYAEGEISKDTTPAPTESQTKVPTDLLKPDKPPEKSELEKAGIYDVSGKLLIDRNLQVNTVSASSATISSATIRGGSITVSTLTVTSSGTLAATTFTDNIKFSPTTKGIIGTTTNDSGAAGNYGEYMSSAPTTMTLGTNNVWTDVAVSTLTAGDWDVSGCVSVDRNGATWTEIDIGISTTAGNSATGLTEGNTRLSNAWASSATTPADVAVCLPAVRMSLSTTTPVFLKEKSSFSANGPPSFNGARISARRVR